MHSRHLCKRTIIAAAAAAAANRMRYRAEPLILLPLWPALTQSAAP